MSLVEYNPPAELTEIDARPRNGLVLAPIFDPGTFEQMQRIAKMMAYAPLVPSHLKVPNNLDASIANCLLVVNQAMKWRMDPFAVAQETFVREGKIGYSGKLVAAAVTSMLRIRLHYYFFGDPGSEERGIIVRDKPQDEDTERELRGTVGQWRTKTKEGQVNFIWANQPDDMLIYRGTRQWCRRYEPSVILGVLTEDEIEDIAARSARDITPRETRSTLAVPPPVPPSPPPVPPAAPPPAAPSNSSAPAPDGEADASATPSAAPAPAVAEAEVVEDEMLPDPDSYLAELDERMAAAETDEDLEEIWSTHLAIAHRVPQEHQRRARKLHFEQQKRFIALEEKPA